jgi:catechol 2,3-dioxygenase-like lactoylglutathione lyase family enzyme
MSSRFHLSLNVTDLDASVRFYEQLLGGGPAKRHPDYAKFETPYLVLSLEPGDAVTRETRVNHLGMRVPGPETLVEQQRRLEMAGISTLREEGVACCYARQSKFWVTDPDGLQWEMYVLEEDLQERGEGQVPLCP